MSILLFAAAAAAPPPAVRQRALASIRIVASFRITPHGWLADPRRLDRIVRDEHGNLMRLRTLELE
jgi:hypothetical protein